MNQKIEHLEIQLRDYEEREKRLKESQTHLMSSLGKGVAGEEGKRTNEMLVSSADVRKTSPTTSGRSRPLTCSRKGSR
jgi:hypothetical protein